MDLTLDEFIRRRKAAAGGPSIDVGKKQECNDKFDKYDIDKDDLDAELEEMMAGPSASAAQQPDTTSYRSSVSKFDRISMQGSDIEDDDDIDMLSTQNSSIEFAKQIQQMAHPNCCKSKPFTTIEDKLKVKIKSQQWRLNGGTPSAEDSNSGIRRGRIGRNYRNRTENVVRGNFTYKLQKGKGEIQGIVRNNKPKPIVYDSVATTSGNNGASLILRKVVNAPGLARPIQVDVDLTELGMNPFAQQRYVPPPPLPAPIPVVETRPPQPSGAVPKGTAQLQMSIEADDLMSFLQAKKAFEARLNATGAAPINETGTPQYAFDAFANGSQM